MGQRYPTLASTARLPNALPLVLLWLILVAAPVYAATKSRRVAFWWATASGLAEPLGAVVGIALLQFVIPAELTGLLFGFVAGMMVFVAIDELLPAARRYQTDKHQVVYGLIAGFAVVALSLLLL